MASNGGGGGLVKKFCGGIFFRVEGADYVFRKKCKINEMPFDLMIGSANRNVVSSKLVAKLGFPMVPIDTPYIMYGISESHEMCRVYNQAEIPFSVKYPDGVYEEKQLFDVVTEDWMMSDAIILGYPWLSDKNVSISNAGGSMQYVLKMDGKSIALVSET